MGAEALRSSITAAARLAEAQTDAIARVVPHFASTLFGDPRYLLLAADVPEEIRRGARDRSEVGIYHDLFLPQRLANLEALVAEFTPAEFTTSIVFVD
jgi:hypothetical protein